MTKKEKLKKNPTVSICTPTYNRRPFIPYIIKCVENQNYPKDKIEWIIIDDGTDKIEDIVSHLPYVKYFKYDDKMTLGTKRNLMHSKATGDVIVYMDDDDYYPPDRIKHAIDTLRSNPKALCVGSSEMYVYFKHIQKMYQFGPYGPNHATAATFAFKREEMLKLTSYDNNASLAEEKHFLKDYTIPFAQLNPMKTILVVSHNHNSFDKKKLLQQGENQFMKMSNKTVDDFIKEPELKKFFMEDIDALLDVYEPGKPENKPDVLKQTEEITQKREKMMEEKKKQIMEQNMLMNVFANQNNMKQHIETMSKENEELKKKVQFLEDKISSLIKELIQAKQQIRQPTL
jgi:glycosyltransferase involved in cell wall biosynthesis